MSDEQRMIEIQRKAYKRGFQDGIFAYAYRENGVHHVGKDKDNKKPLKNALDELEGTWNYEP